MILESRGRDRGKVIEEVKAGTFVAKYWDARVFGNTFLEKRPPNILLLAWSSSDLGCRWHQ